MKTEKIIVFLIVIFIASYIIYERVKANKNIPAVNPSPSTVNQNSFVGVPGIIPDFVPSTPTNMGSTIAYA